ncbi:hypothetical protein GCM10017161_07590 [Thalassotalea marina]|uniref:Prepilin-type N-terminal cleavage/methylation domain-containing protein n=2 Tax=Thalassotalea marina TaxID=1673741 RepID=A0A919BE69_9GAMM|nr:hypothetical protein GCM10017161_07590 [Thalassotalea marina]
MAARGFTLIELVIVIVVIGILAIVAIPKFVSLQLDAKNATLTGLKSGIESSRTLIYNKALAKDLHQEQNASVLVDGKLVPISYGYPLSDITLWQDGYFRLDVNYFKHSKSSDNLAMLFYFKERSPQPTTINDSCIVHYFAATSSSPAVVGFNQCLE